jgi:hypothetical protein
MQGGAVIKSNLPIERHASKIYTRTMFEMFGRVLCIAGYYFVEELEPKRRYAAIHGNPEKRDPWFKSRYEVVISDDQSKYTFECGRYEHMGMICCHILKVILKLIEHYKHSQRFVVFNHLMSCCFAGYDNP